MARFPLYAVNLLSLKISLYFTSFQARFLILSAYQANDCLNAREKHA
jgi:hypothetical protein